MKSIRVLKMVSLSSLYNRAFLNAKISWNTVHSVIINWNRLNSVEEGLPYQLFVVLIKTRIKCHSWRSSKLFSLSLYRVARHWTRIFLLCLLLTKIKKALGGNPPGNFTCGHMFKRAITSSQIGTYLTNSVLECIALLSEFSLALI